MCSGVQYHYENQEVTTYFIHPSATIPVMRRDDSIILLPWGRRQNESGQLPLGGWAMLETIEQGRWDKFRPKFIKIPAQQFMERDLAETEHWFNLRRGRYLQGLVARRAEETRVYIVTAIPRQFNAIYQRLPRIITNRAEYTQRDDL